MESLDKVNGRLLSDPDSVNRACASVAGLKQRLTALGFTLKRSDPLRITINARAWGWSGTEFAAFLRAYGAECEMADENYVVLLFSAITSPDDCQRGISGYPSEAGNQHSRSGVRKTAQRFRRRSKREGLRRNTGLMPARNSDSNARRAYRQRSRRGSEALRREIRRDPRLIHAGFSGGKILR